MSRALPRFLVLAHADLQEGFREIARHMLAACALFLGLMVLLLLKMGASGIPLSEASFTDFVLSAAGGGAPYRPESHAPFPLPIEWMLTMLLMMFIPLGYPLRNSMGIGKTLMIASGGRWNWWLSKCLWIILYVMAYWMCMLVVAALCSLLVSGELDPAPSESLYAFTWIDRFALVNGPRLLMPALGAAIAMSCALCLAQLVLSLVIRPILSYACGATLLFASAFFFNPLLTGNYLMLSRSGVFIEHGTDPLVGCTIGAAISILSACIGGYAFQRTDLLDKEYSS